METYGGHAMHCQRTICHGNKRLIDLRLIDMKENLSASGDTYEIHAYQIALVGSIQIFHLCYASINNQFSILY